jgi:two-component system sensor histidine kinase HydH
MIKRPAWFGQLRAASLTTRFAVYSFVCIGLMTAILWLIVSNYLLKQILEREWQTTAQLVRADVRKFLEAYDFQAKDRKSVGHKFAALLDHMRLSPEIVRFRVYNPSALVIWSDDKQLVGKSFADDLQLQSALRGEVIANLSPSSKKGVSDATAPGKIVEVYVPIYSESGQLLGVFETYRRADSVLRHVREARVVVLLTAAAGGLLIYVCLFAIVRQAARKIDEQQANLLKMQSELIASQRMAVMGETAAAVAHGIGNPLSSIRAAAQVALLQAERDCAPAAQEITGNLQDIVREVDRVQKRMQGLLNFAKPLEPRAVSVDVNVLVRDAVVSMRSRFAEARIQANLDLAPALPSVNADLGHLEQALLGLMTNAAEATPQGGVVTIRTRCSPLDVRSSTVHVCVEDTGEGIPAENLSRVFEPFFTTKPHGTGIGLPLARKFVEINGGTVVIRNAARSGTTAEITLPAAAGEHALICESTVERHEDARLSSS